MEFKTTEVFYDLDELVEFFTNITTTGGKTVLVNGKICTINGFHNHGCFFILTENEIVKMFFDFYPEIGLKITFTEDLSCMKIIA